MGNRQGAAMAFMVLGLAGCGLVGSRASPTTAASTTTVAPNEAAETALRRQFLELSQAQYGRAWDEIVPAQQEIGVPLRNVAPTDK